MKFSSRSPVFLFSVIAFGVMAVIAMGLAVFLSNTIRSNAIDALAVEAVGDARGPILGVITPADLEAPITGHRYDTIHRFVQESIVSDSTARIKLWARDGTIVYSNERETVGTKFPENWHVLAAMQGRRVAGLASPEDAEHARSADIGDLIEVYAPIVFPGDDEPRGVFEIYQYYEPTARLISDTLRSTLAAIGVGFLVLYGGLVFAVWKLDSATTKLDRLGRKP